MTHRDEILKRKRELEKAKHEQYVDELAADEERIKHANRMHEMFENEKSDRAHESSIDVEDAQLRKQFNDDLFQEERQDLVEHLFEDHEIHERHHEEALKEKIRSIHSIDHSDTVQLHRAEDALQRLKNSL